MGILKQMLGLEGASQTGNSTSTSNSTTKTTLDPAIQSLIFGGNGSQGLLAQYQGLLNQPQSAASQAWANANGNYLTQNGTSDLGAIRNTAQGLMAGGTAASAGGGVGMGDVLWNKGETVNAPAQNNIDLTSSYQNLLSGGNTNALMNSLQAGNNLTSAQFQKNQTDITNNLTRNVLPSIRGGAIAAGQYGSSRQGIAEGNALSDYTNQLTSANNQLSAANSANTANALAGAYENGQNRILSATQGLGAQQYGVASQNATLAQQANLANQAIGNNASQFNASQVQDANKFNAGLQAQQNQLNNSAALGGSGLLSGLLGATGNNVNAQDMYGITRAQGVNGLLAPYLAANSTTTKTGTDTSPIYQNRGQGLLSSLGSFGSLFG